MTKRFAGSITACDDNPEGHNQYSGGGGKSGVGRVEGRKLGPIHTATTKAAETASTKANSYGMKSSMQAHHAHKDAAAAHQAAYKEQFHSDKEKAGAHLRAAQEHERMAKVLSPSNQIAYKTLLAKR
jgi:hypothetical protein